MDNFSFDQHLKRLYSWKGKYTYEEGFPIDASFDFELKVQYNDGSFDGIAIEEEFTKLSGESAHVKGFIEEDYISFVKTYPFKFEEQEDGTVVIDRNERGHKVEYDGYFNSEQNRWEGNWNIVSDEIKIFADEYEIFEKGFWYMNGRRP